MVFCTVTGGEGTVIINIRLVASCWFLSLHPTFMMHGHKGLKLGITFQHLENYNIWSPFGSEGVGYRKFYCNNLLVFTMLLIRVFSCDKFLYVHQHVTVLISEIIFSVVASVQH